MPAHLDWLRALPMTAVYRDAVYLCHATPADDNVYWLETVTPDGAVRMAADRGDRENARRASRSR